MLKGIDPLLGPDLLHVLAMMGHGDEIVIVDANFPAASVGEQTVYGSPLAIGCDAIKALAAILSVLPLDAFEPDPVVTMQVVGEPDTVPPAIADALPIIKAEGYEPASLERFDFYQRASEAFAIVATSEMRPYGNFILRKGVIFS